jgi:hypothetical protein
MGLRTSSPQEHRYQLCKDEYCERFPCRVYREGYDAGYADGHGAGYSAGAADGYAAGYSDGAADAGE